MKIPVFSGKDVEAAVSPERALEAVRRAFVAYANGEWTMPPKVYVPAYPAGDFRAMPALGGGHALLKWVTSFPGNPAHGLPTVTGLVLLSDAANGMLKAALDAGAVTALRTGAAAVVAAETLGRDGTASVIGAGVNGRAAVRTFVARGRRVLLYDIDGREIVFPEGSLQAGQHVSLMGADGPGKSEIAVAEMARVRVFCDDWEKGELNRTLNPNAPVRVFCDDWQQASHNGDLAHAVEAGAIARDDVTELGDVLTGKAPGRQSDDDITIFDSTGLAIQDLAIALAALEQADELDLPMLEL